MTLTATARRPQAARDLAFVRCPRRIRRALGWHRRGGHGVAFTRFALLAAAMLSSTPLLANPNGAQVVAGKVDLVSSVPATLDIRQGTSKAIINWQRFDIAAGETVNFVQPSADSVALNRVLGKDPSAIFGRLTANGTVLLVNPNGVVFGPSARVDVGGLVASTANLRDDDFLAGRYRFGEASANTQARIVNAGEFSIRDRGLAALVAPRVSNSGVIEARLGRVMLGGAERFTLDFHGDGLLSFDAGAAVDAQVRNSGTLRADGGTVLLAASAVKGVVDQVINTSGVVSATTVSGSAGRIVLSGGEHGTVAVAGSVQAGGSRGGTVVVGGEHVQVAGGARIDVSGDAGGGEIALGSDGRAAGYANKSATTTVERGARLSADALVQGDGGHVTLWSTDTTRFAGSLSARGGAQGGHGGFAEVSSRHNLGLEGQVDLRAAHGASGTLLLDPTDLRITDSAAGGSQDGNAGDATVAAGDANQGSGATLNTVSRGLLESLSGNANIVLQATGQITVDAMAGGRLDLATTAGHGFTLQSTQSGGIRFADAATEIRTQGGAITLEAQGIGSTLANIGKLTSNGGAITLKATGDIQLANTLDAGSGAVAVRSTAGSIANAAGAAPVLRGSAVTLSAAGGHVGSAGHAIATHTTNLALESGGHAVASSDLALADLSLTANHVAPTTANDYQVSAPGLALQLADGATLGVTTIAQPTGLNLTVQADHSLQLGSIDVGSGSAVLRSTGGNLVGTAGGTVAAGSVTLQAAGTTGSNGAIGSAGQSVRTGTAHLDATAGSGGVNVANTGVLALDRLSASGASSVTSTGSLTVAQADTGSAALALGSSAGSVLDDGNAATTIASGPLTLTAGGAIGTAGTRVSTTAATLSANAAQGGVYVGTSATSSTLSSIVSGNGAVDVRTGGATTIGSITSTTSAPANGITVAATGAGSIAVGSIDAGASGNVSVSTTGGSITGNSGNITGNRVALTTAAGGSVSVRTAAAHLDVQATGSIAVTQTGAVVLDRIATTSTFASVTASTGDITVGNVATATNGQASLTATTGVIVDDGDASTRIITGTAVLNAGGRIGSAGHAVQTKATGLTATSTGDLVVTNTDATLTSLSLTNRHTTPGVANTLQVTSPYLAFDVIDDGTQTSLNRLVGVPLASLAFSADQTLRVGQVQGGGTVNLSATQGSLVDDGNDRSRVTAGSTLTLAAAQGSVGSVAAPIGVNAASLSLTTRGDLYVADVADLSSLTIASSHPDAVTSFGIGITAPSLRLAVTDSAAGHAVNTLTDTSSLTLNFTSDRDITLGRVDLTTSGTARFTSTGGRILDDGDKTTRVLANSTALAGQAIGAAGAAHLDVVTGTLAATASAGGVYVELPMPTGSTNTASTVTLGTITATGPVSISALEGNLSLGGFLTATNQAVSLSAAQGGIYSPSGYSIGVGTGSLALNAATGIGTAAAPLPVTASAGASLTAQAGTSIAMSASGPLALTSLDAGTAITYTQTSGAITVGHVDAGAAGTVALTATTGAIQDDGNAGTTIRAQQVTLSAAQGSIGSGTAIAVDAPKLLLTAKGDIGVTDAATLDTLSITRASASAGSIALAAGAGQSFTITEDAAAHDLQAVSSTTPLAFAFSGQRDVKIGAIAVGAAGSATIGSATNLVAGSVPGAGIQAGTVSLTAGTAGSIGAAGNAVGLGGTTALTVNAGREIHVASDTTLTDLAITSTNTTTAAGTASQFDIAAAGQTFTITDSGTTQTLDFSGTALGSAAFTTRKNIQVGAINATGDVTLATSGGGANSNISSDGGSGRIAANRLLLTASSSTAGGGSIGSNSRALRVDTPSIIASGSANIYIADAQSLTQLDLTVTHGTNTTFGYDITAGNLTLGISDGNTQGLSLATSGSMDFAYSVDRALSLGTVDAGTSSTGSVTLTSRSAPTGTSPRINRGSGSITGGHVTLSAVGTNGGVGAAGTLSTNTQNLSIASGGNVSVSNSTTLSSLSLDAQHRTTGTTTHSYAISSTGLTFSISDSIGSNAFQLSNITQSGLALSVKADRTITATRVNTGAGGTVTLTSSSAVQGGSGANAGSPSITTGDLTLRGGSAYGYQGSTPLYTAVGTLSSSLTSTLYLSNAGALTLNTNTVGSSADVASSNNSLLQGGGVFTAPTLKLSANQSLGATGSLLTDARRLTLVSGANIDVANASDLYALSITSAHRTPGAQATLAVTAPRLSLALTDSVPGDELHLANLVDSSGLDFTLSGDVALSLGSVDVQAGRALALYSTNGSITNDGAGLLKAGTVMLSASGSVGATGSSTTRMQTDALTLAVTTGANAYVDNAQDLSGLSLTSTQAAGGTPPVYQVRAPALTFDVTDDGVTHVNQVADTTGLNFTLSTRRDQAVGIIDTGRSGTVSLASAGDILGDADSSRRIVGASVALAATAGGAIGSVSNPVHLTAPLVSFAPTGALNIESDTHIDRLGISTTHPTVTYGGTYSIVSTPITGTAYALFTATDGVTGTALTSLVDPLGLAFSFTSDRAMQVGSLDLGSTGTVALTGTGSGGILGDGDAGTQVRAASLSMASLGGAVGGAGAGNAIDATVNTVSATALGGGVTLALHGATTLGSISGTGGVTLANDTGDIALGAIDAGGQAVVIDNQGGSILSGSIVNTTAVTLTASGSIGNTSSIGLSANGGGTTTLTASASAAHGATGSIDVSESYGLAAASVTAPGAVTLASGYGMALGTVTSGAAVTIDSSQGSITGINGSNAITGSSVALTARFGGDIGSSGTRLNLATPNLVLNTPGSVYVTNSADLTQLTIDRTNYAGTTSAGTLSVIASGLTLAATDAANTTTLTTLSDATGLDFSYLGIGSLAIGSVDAGSGIVLLRAQLSGGDGNIDAVNGASRITAGNLTLQAVGSGSRIGSVATPLGLSAGTLTASAGSGGIALSQAGSLTLSSLTTTGDLAVTATSGDLTIGTLSYGSAKTLNLTASAGRLLAGGGTIAGGGAGAAVTLSAAGGIGTELAPIRVNAAAGHTVSASVTGSGSLYLASVGSLNGGLTTAVHDGATVVTSAGAIKLASMTSGTDAAGNDIRVTATAGDITVQSVSGGAGAAHSAVELTASAGKLLAAPGATLEAFEVSLYGATGVGSAANRVAADGQRVQVGSNGGAIYLGASTNAVLSSVDSHGGAIDIVHTADLQLASARSGGGTITVNGTAPAARLVAGNLDAGSGAVSLTASGAGASIVDDGDSATRITGASVVLNAAGAIGSMAQAVQTSSASLTASTGGELAIDDARSAGVTLASVVSSNGGVRVRSTGDMTVVDVRATNGVDAVTLDSSTAILASGNGPHVTARRAFISAGGNVGAGAGAPLRVDLATGSLVLTAGGSAAVATTGNLDLSAGLDVQHGDLALGADGLLTLPAAALTTTGGVTLRGGQDVITSAAGAAARRLEVNATSLVLDSGAAGGSTELVTTVGSLTATLTGAGNLTVTNTGTLASTTLATADGHIDATSSNGLTATQVVAGGANRHIGLTATAGDLAVGTVDAGSAGTISLSAAQGALTGMAPDLTAATLNLVSGSGIGSAGAAFATRAQQVSAQVTGNGGIYLSSTAALTVNQLSTNGGDIAVSAAGGIDLGAVTTTGTQHYTGALTLRGDLAGAAIVVDGDLTLAGGARSLAGDLHVTGALHGGGFGATLSGGSGNVVIDGAASALASLDASGAAVRVGSVATSGAQSYQGATTLNGSYTTQGGAFTVTGATQLAGSTQIDAGSGAVTFGGTLGGAQSLAVTSSGATRLDGAVQLASLTTDAAGTLAIHGGSVTTTGTQSYGERLVLGSDLVLSGSSVALQQGADAAAAGQQGLVLVGNVVLPAALGGQAALKNVGVTGNAVLGGGRVVTTGAQSWGGTLALGADTVLAADGGVSVAGTIDGAAQLLVAAGAGNVSFGGAIGGTTALASLGVSGNGTTTLGGSVTTTGSQVYQQHVVVAHDAVLSGTSMALAGGIDAASTGGASLVIDGHATLGGDIGAVHALNGFTITGSATMGAGSVGTTGAQHYGGALVLAGNQVLRGGAVGFDGSVTGARSLTVESAGATRFGGAVSLASLTTDAAGTLAIDGGQVTTTGAQVYGERAVLGAATTLSGTAITLTQGAQGPALTVAGQAVLGGDVTTTGAQAYGGTLGLAGDVALTANGVSVAGAIDGAQALTIDAGSSDANLGGAVGATTRLGALTIRSGGATTLAGAVRAASLATDAAGSLLIGGGSVDTTGAQAWGERVVLGADTTLTGSSITMRAGADATTAGAQGLAIDGQAELGGPIGAQAALSRLAVTGGSTLAAGSITTTGDQRFDGAVRLTGDQVLRSTGGTVRLAGTLDGSGGVQPLAASVDGSGRANLVLASDAGAIAVDGAVGSTAALGALTVRAGTTLDFGGSVRAYSLRQTVGGVSHHLGTVEVDGIDGIELRAASVRFEQAVTSAGALDVTLTDAAGTLGFAAAANVDAATGFVQRGGASVLLPASVRVARGPIALEAPATLQGSTAHIETEGDITITGLAGAQTALTIATGHGRLGSAGAGRLLVGLDDGNALHRLDVASLTVPDARSAALFGRIGGMDGAMTATLVRGGLMNAPYFANGTPWGQFDVINRLVSTTVPPSVVPSVPGLMPLFTRQATPESLAPDAVGAFRSPEVLRLQGDAVNTTGMR